MLFSTLRWQSSLPHPCILSSMFGPVPRGASQHAHTHTHRRASTEQGASLTFRGCVQRRRERERFNVWWCDVCVMWLEDGRVDRLTLGLCGEGQCEFGKQLLVLIALLLRLHPETALRKILRCDLAQQNTLVNAYIHLHTSYAFRYLFFSFTQHPTNM